MTTRILKRVLIFSFLLSINTVSNANSESESFQSRMNAHTSRLSAANHEYGYGFIARRLFHLVRAGKTLGLSDADLAIIKDAGRPDFTRTKEAMKPFLDEISRRLNDNGNIVEMASLFEKARYVEQQADNEFYRRVIGQLSNNGQALFLQAHADQMTRATITQIDFVSLAAERPDEVRAMLVNTASNFGDIKADSLGSTFTSSGGDLGIESTKRNKRDE